jgi:prepilin-type N-terminal cleavage/methylation domain-containing protein
MNIRDINVSHLSSFRSTDQLGSVKHIGIMRGFTIVELLIVVVIIGILAAIVIVAYNGVTNRAKTSKSQSTASTILKKFEAYNAEVGSYPAAWSSMSATSTASYYIPAASYTLKTTTTWASSDTEITFDLYSCSTGGLRVRSYDYTNGGFNLKYIGPCTGAATFTQITS